MNAITKKLINQVIGYSDNDYSDALVALYYISTRWHGGQDDPLYAVAHLTGFCPNYTDLDDEEESGAKMIYDEMEWYCEQKKDVDWVVITKFFNREFNKKEY